LSESDEKALGPADVAEPIQVFVLDHFAADLWAGHLHQSLSTQWPWIILASAGIGFVLTPATTDAANRAPRGSYGEVTGLTQTVRYVTASLGLAILGSVLIHQTRSDAKASLARLHIPKTIASKIVASISTGAGTTPPKQHGASIAFAASRAISPRRPGSSTSQWPGSWPQPSLSPSAAWQAADQPRSPRQSRPKPFTTRRRERLDHVNHACSPLACASVVSLVPELPTT
jgi:hypothetical protein